MDLKRNSASPENPSRYRTRMPPRLKRCRTPVDYLKAHGVTDADVKAAPAAAAPPRRVPVSTTAPKAAAKPARSLRKRPPRLRKKPLPGRLNPPAKAKPYKRYNLVSSITQDILQAKQASALLSELGALHCAACGVAGGARHGGAQRPLHKSGERVRPGRICRVRAGPPRGTASPRVEDVTSTASATM